ncbi:MAG: polyprenyl diphosphate synthase, partial [Clostridia bacterium]
YLNNDSSYYLNNNIKLVTSGDISKLPKEIFEKLEDLKEKSKNNSGLCVNLCLNYGGRDEILMAINLLLKEKKDNISLDEFKNCLYTASLPDPDLVIRTSGECRLSNFMLFQVAYSELYCPKVLWPDFGKRHFKKAIIEFQKRDRRFGAIKKS